MKIFYQMVGILICVFGLSSCSAQESICPISNNPDDMYNHFYKTSYKATGMSESGNKAAEIIDLSEQDGLEAWACLEKAANMNHCASLFTLELHHRHGIRPHMYGFTPSEKRADEIKTIYQKQCSIDD